MALRQDVGLSWLLVVSIPALLLGVGSRDHADGPAVPGDAEPHRRASTACCASRSPASAWSARSCASRTRRHASPTSTTTLTDTALRVGRLMALMFPIVMLVLNVSSVAVHLVRRRPHRRADRSQIGALIAFLTYLMQILMAVMMATFMLVLVPRAVGVRRPHRGGARHRVVGAAARAPRDRGLAAGRARAARRQLPLPGRGRAGARRHLVHVARRARPPRSSAAPAPARRR